MDRSSIPQATTGRPRATPRNAATSGWPRPAVRADEGPPIYWVLVVNDNRRSNPSAPRSRRGGWDSGDHASPRRVTGGDHPV